MPPNDMNINNVRSMKKIVLFVVCSLICSVADAQQSSLPAQKHSVATNTFWSNWFVQAQVAGSSFYGDHSNVPSGLMKDFRTNLGASVALGKWFTPGLGLRTKLNGFWGRSAYTEDKSLNAMKYWTLQEQALFNLSNMLYGYNSMRTWNFIPYIGGGVARNMSCNTYAMGLTVGLLNQWRLSTRLDVNLDISWGVFEPDFDGAGFVMGKGLKTKDQIANLEVGLTYRLGSKGFSCTPDVDALRTLTQSQIDALNAQLADEQAENVRLRQLLSNQVPQEHKPIIINEVVTVPVSVFFNIGQSKIASRKDLQNVSELAAIANARDAKLIVTGYADSQTGSADYNQNLSQRRAETVADELEKMRVSRNRIIVVAAGGVDALSPASYNRRVVVEMK